MKFLFEFLPIALFVIVYKVYDDMFIATAVFMVVFAIQLGFYWLKHRRLEKMHIITLVLVTVLGGATLLFQNKDFFMWKPTAVNWAFGLAFLGSQFIGKKPLVERMMGHAIEAPAAIWRRLNISWIVFFFAMGFANLYVANFYFQAETRLNIAAGKTVELETCPDTYQEPILDLCRQAKQYENTWVNFKFYGVIGLTILFVIGQAFYLARFMKDQDAQPAPTEPNNET
ncbi:MAG: septation protein IspZ [Proteobacteria bacterium]|nr:septation protein IspZ [Pseudomonadota bacterium]